MSKQILKIKFVLGISKNERLRGFDNELLPHPALARHPLPQGRAEQPDSGQAFQDEGAASTHSACPPPIPPPEPRRHQRQEPRPSIVEGQGAERYVVEGGRALRVS